MKAILAACVWLAVLFFLPAVAQAVPPGCNPVGEGADAYRAYANGECKDEGESGPGQPAVQIYLPAVLERHPEEAVEDQVTTGDPAQYHLVRPGDALVKIARSYNTTVNVLMLANPHVTNPALIHVGDRLRIPTPLEIERLESEAEQRRAAAQRRVVAETPHQGERWIDVDLRTQTVRAYAGDSLVKTFSASTGTANHPTVTGQFRIWVKLEKDDMRGQGYHLKNVPSVMYFYKGYGLHGTYWHSNFGTPMSHGCVNLSVEDAAWLFDFASVGTLVNVH